jgi:hypothetical protein
LLSLGTNPQKKGCPVWGSPCYLPTDPYFSSFKVAAQARLTDPIITTGIAHLL